MIEPKYIVTFVKYTVLEFWLATLASFYFLRRARAVLGGELWGKNIQNVLVAIICVY